MEKIGNKVCKVLGLFFIAFVFTACGEPIEFRYSSSQAVSEEDELKLNRDLLNRKELRENEGATIIINNYGYQQGGQQHAPHGCGPQSAVQNCCVHCPCSPWDSKGFGSQSGIFNDINGERYKIMGQDNVRCEIVVQQYRRPLTSAFGLTIGEEKVFQRLKGESNNSFKEVGNARLSSSIGFQNNQLELFRLSLQQRLSSQLSSLVSQELSQLDLKEAFGEGVEVVLDRTSGGYHLVKEVEEELCATVREPVKAYIDGEGNVLRIERLISPSGGGDRSSFVSGTKRPDTEEKLDEHKDVASLDPFSGVDSDDKDDNMKIEDGESHTGRKRRILEGACPDGNLECQRLLLQKDREKADDKVDEGGERTGVATSVTNEDQSGTQEGSVTETQLKTREQTIVISDKYIQKTRKNLKVLFVISPVIGEELVDFRYQNAQGKNMPRLGLGLAIQELAKDLTKLGIHWQFAFVSSEYEGDMDKFGKLEPIMYGYNNYSEGESNKKGVAFERYVDSSKIFFKKGDMHLNQNFQGTHLTLENMVYFSIFSDDEFAFSGFYCSLSCETNAPLGAVLETFRSSNDRNKTFGFFNGVDQPADLALVVVSERDEPQTQYDENLSVLTGQSFLEEMKGLRRGGNVSKNFKGSRKIIPVGILNRAQSPHQDLPDEYAVLGPKISTCDSNLARGKVTPALQIEEAMQDTNQRSSLFQKLNTSKQSQSIVDICRPDEYYYEKGNKVKGLAVISNYYRENSNIGKTYETPRDSEVRVIFKPDLSLSFSDQYVKGSLKITVGRSNEQVLGLDLYKVNVFRSGGETKKQLEPLKKAGQSGRTIELTDITLKKDTELRIVYTVKELTVSSSDSRE